MALLWWLNQDDAYAGLFMKHGYMGVLVKYRRRDAETSALKLSVSKGNGKGEFFPVHTMKACGGVEV